MKTSKKIILFAASVSLVSLFAFKLVSSAWIINSKEAKISFLAKGGQHTGTISDLVATFDFDPAHPELASIKATIELKNLQADNEKLTGHLMTADFFDAANHPTITFTGEQVTKNDTGFVAIGKLAIRDSVHTVSIPFTFKQIEKKATIVGSMNIFAGDYGVGKKSSSGGDRVLISIEVPVSQE